MPALEHAFDPKLAALAWELAQARQRTDELFRLTPEAVLFERPIAERHRLAFYLGRLEAAHTARSLLRWSFRNGLQPHYPYVFADFRCLDES